MPGVRISGLPAKVTEKHLKIYFSNPRNGGGHIKNIYHPLPHASAVVLFDDDRVVDEILKKSHQITGKQVDVSPVPKQVFRRAVVEVEKNVSQFLSLNPQLVDELQFIGELNVSFQYEKEKYLIDGSWYQIEWALHYLDAMLEAFQFDMGSEFQSRGPSRNTQNRTMAAERARTDFRENSPPRSKEIKHPNIPVVNRVQEDEQTMSLPLTSGTKMSNFRTFTGTQSRAAEDLSHRPSKNKNATSEISQANSELESIERKLYGRTVLANLNNDKQNQNQSHFKGQGGTRQGNLGAQKFNDEDENLDQGAYFNSQPPYKPFAGPDDSDSENEANLAAAYDRTVGFADDTNFQENKRRPHRVVPRMTKGIDVSRTDFGEAPNSFTFEVSGNLKIHVARDDITKQATDTIINPTTPGLSNIYGVSRAISAAAGYDMLMECQRYVEEKGPLNFAGVMHTSAGGKLCQKVGFVLHTAGPSWHDEDSERCTHLLVCTYINCFQYADQKLWVRSLATPLISAGAFGFPLDVCIGAFYDALLLFSTRSSTKRHLKEIHLVCFDQESTMATIMIVQSLLDCGSTQSAVAASDRYWMCVSKYNFHAESFGKSDEKNKESDDDSIDDDKVKENATVVKQEKNIEASKVDTNQEPDTDDSNTDQKNGTGIIESQKGPEQGATNQNVAPKCETADVTDDSDSDLDEMLKPYLNSKTTERKPGVKEDSASFYEKLGLKHESKVEVNFSDSEDSDDYGLNKNEDISRSDPVGMSMAKTEPGNVEKTSAYSEKVEAVNLSGDDDFSDDDSKEFRNLGKDKEPESAETKGDGEDKTNNGFNQDGKQSGAEWTDVDEKEKFKTSFGKLSLAEDNKWSIVADVDGAEEASVIDDHKSEGGKTEEIYL